MRILIHSNMPGRGTGYGKQAGILAEGLARLGHDVACSAFSGLHGNVTTWRDIPVYPGGRESWGNDIVAGHYRHWRADALITLMDTRNLAPEALEDERLTIACLTPIDTHDRISQGDEDVLRKLHPLPLAISQHGRRMLEDAFFKPMYAPHGIDTAIFSPPADREALREKMGLAGRFVIGINAANTDGSRKAYSEQFHAFARFHAKHPDALLLVHTVADNAWWGGITLRKLRDRLGLTTEAVKFADEHDIISGLYTDEALARWYGALDVLSNASRGEGFGLPVIEAQACGTPVIVNNASAMPELRGSGWLVDGQPIWNELHWAHWVIPDIDQIVAAYELARRAGERKRAQAREFALRYDAKAVIDKYWPPVLERLTS